MKQSKDKIIKKIFIAVIVIVLLVIPFLLIDYCLLEPWSYENRVSTVSLIIAYDTLLATIGIAYFIYYLQKRDSEREERQRLEQAREAMLLELENAFEFYFLMPGNRRDERICDGIKDVLSTNAGELRKYLTPQEFHHLVEIVNTIHNSGDDFNSISEYLQGWLQILFESEYQKYFCCVLDYADLLDSRTFHLFCRLKDENRKYEEKEQIFDQDGECLFEKNGEKIRVISGGIVYLDGKLGIDEIYDRPVILEGYGCSENYEGFYKNGAYHGKGAECI